MPLKRILPSPVLCYLSGFHAYNVNAEILRQSISFTHFRSVKNSVKYLYNSIICEICIMAQFTVSLQQKLKIFDGYAGTATKNPLQCQAKATKISGLEYNRINKNNDNNKNAGRFLKACIFENLFFYCLTFKNSTLMETG